MKARAQQQRSEAPASRPQSDVAPIGSNGEGRSVEVGSLFPSGDPKSRDRLYAGLSEPRFLEGDAERGRRVIERWERAAANGSTPAMSATAAALLWSGDMGNGWILDDETGELVARLDPGWLLERWRRASQTSPQPNEDRKAVTESGFIQRSTSAGRTRTG